jgi:hypothetical protein
MTIAPLFMAFFAAVAGGDFVPSVLRLAGRGMRMKAPGAVIDYPIQWALETGETISTSAWAVTPAGEMVVEAGSGVIDGLVTACLVSGGVFRRVYSLKNTITTSAGRTLEETITIRVGPVEAQ